MAKVGESLARGREQYQDQGWFKSWFNSILAGPLIMLLLVFTLGPFIFNKLVQVIQQRFRIMTLLAEVIEDLAANHCQLKAWVHIALQEIAKMA